MSLRKGVYIPGNFFYSPRTSDLLPELKLLHVALHPEMNCAGVGIINIKPFAALVGLSSDAAAAGLDVLQQKGLIATDKNTGEVFLTDWFRFQEFKNGLSYGMLQRAVSKIESGTLRQLVLSKMPPAPPGKGSTPAAAPGAAGAPADQIDETGVILRTSADHQQLAALCSRHGTDRIRLIVERVRADGVRPFVSTILALLKPDRNSNSDRARGLTGTVEAEQEMNREYFREHGKPRPVVDKI